MLMLHTYTCANTTTAHPTTLPVPLFLSLPPVRDRPGGEKIREIEKLSGARVQVVRSEAALTQAFGVGARTAGAAAVMAEREAARAAAGIFVDGGGKGKVEEAGKTITAGGVTTAADPRRFAEEALAAARRASGATTAAARVAAITHAPEHNAPFVTIHIYGTAEACDRARELVADAAAGLEAKRDRLRQRAYDKKREARRRARELYWQRHRADYEALGCTPGTPKSQLRKSYRALALKWHPDKHGGCAAAAAKFQMIQAAFDALMSTDESESQAQLPSQAGGGGGGGGGGGVGGQSRTMKPI